MSACHQSCNFLLQNVKSSNEQTSKVNRWHQNGTHWRGMTITLYINILLLHAEDKASMLTPLKGTETSQVHVRNQDSFV